MHLLHARARASRVASRAHESAADGAGAAARAGGMLAVRPHHPSHHTGAWGLVQGLQGLQVGAECRGAMCQCVHAWGQWVQRACCNNWIWRAACCAIPPHRPSYRLLHGGRLAQVGVPGREGQWGHRVQQLLGARPSQLTNPPQALGDVGMQGAACAGGVKVVLQPTS